MDSIRPEKLTLKSLLIELQALGIIESRGMQYKKTASIKERAGITTEEINEILSMIMPVLQPDFAPTEDFTRQIKNTKPVFNQSSSAFSIDTDNKRAGYMFRRNRDGAGRPEDLKFDRAYETFFTLTLALMHLDHSADLDIFTQFRALDFPLASLLFLQYCIHAGKFISFDYQNRSDKPERIKSLVPVRIVLRNGHWILIGRDTQKHAWIQYMVHSIRNLLGGEECADPIPNLDVQQYFGDIWGHAMLLGTEGPTVVQIQVPANLKDRVQKRRSEGSWAKGDSADHLIWEVPVFDLDDLLSYIFRWNGHLKILGPQEAILRFKQMLQSHLEQY